MNEDHKTFLTVYQKFYEDAKELGITHEEVPFIFAAYVQSKDLHKIYGALADIRKVAADWVYD